MLMKLNFNGSLSSTVHRNQRDGHFFVQKKNDHHKIVNSFKGVTCRLEDSNLRPPVYKTGALPTELSRQICG